jgi:oligoribonuclease
MKYVSIDIETLGLDPDQHDIVEFAAVMDDLRDRKPLDKLQTFHRFIYNENDLYQGSAYAIAMHQRIWDKLKYWEGGRGLGFYKTDRDPNDFTTKDMLLVVFNNWLVDNGYKPDDNGKVRVQVAGKNFASFDKRFLEQQCMLDHRVMNVDVVFGHRVIDPGMLYFDPRIDNAVPSMSDCQKRAGLSDVVAHTAMDDAMMVVQLLRHKL